jgi:ABC-2 type transport system permease protein
LHYSQNYPLPLGFDQFTRQTFGNKDFVLNALNYLVDENGLISIRSREIKIRLLDRNRMLEQMVFVKTINVAAPLIFVLFLGMILYWRRKKKYA